METVYLPLLILYVWCVKLNYVIWKKYKMIHFLFIPKIRNNLNPLY